jgi:hypothetical protein
MPLNLRRLRAPRCRRLLSAESAVVKLSPSLLQQLAPFARRAVRTSNLCVPRHRRGTLRCSPANLFDDGGNQGRAPRGGVGPPKTQLSGSEDLIRLVGPADSPSATASGALTGPTVKTLGFPRKRFSGRAPTTPSPPRATGRPGQAMVAHACPPPLSLTGRNIMTRIFDVNNLVTEIDSGYPGGGVAPVPATSRVAGANRRLGSCARIGGVIWRSGTAEFIPGRNPSIRTHLRCRRIVWFASRGMSTLERHPQGVSGRHFDPEKAKTPRSPRGFREWAVKESNLQPWD